MCGHAAEQRSCFGFAEREPDEVLGWEQCRQPEAREQQWMARRADHRREQHRHEPLPLPHERAEEAAPCIRVPAECLVHGRNIALQHDAPARC